MKEERQLILEKDDGLQEDISSKNKYALFLGLTFALCLAFFTIGSAYTVTGPVLLQLARIANVEVSVITWSLTTRGFGIGIGSLSRGHLMDFSRHRVISSLCMFFTIAVATGVISWCSNLVAMLFAFFVQGLMIGIIEADSNDYCIKIWGKDHAPYLLAVYTFFNVGGFTAPLIATSFITPGTVSVAPFNGSYALKQNGIHEIGLLNISNDRPSLHLLQYGSTSDGELVQWRMGTLHFIIGSFAIFTGLFMAVMSYLTRHWECCEPKCESSLSVDHKISSPCKRNILISLFSLYIFVIIGVNITYVSLLTAFVVKQLHASEHVGSVMATTAWAVGSLGSLIFVPVSRMLSASTVILINLVTSTCAMILFSIAGGFSMSSVWVASILLGSTIGTSYAATFSWANQYIELSVGVSSIIVACSTFGEMFFPAIIGPFLDTNPLVFPYVTVGWSVSCLAVYALAEVLGRRYLRQETSKRSNISMEKRDNLDDYEYVPQ